MRIEGERLQGPEGQRRTDQPGRYCETGARGRRIYKVSQDYSEDQVTIMTQEKVQVYSLLNILKDPIKGQMDGSTGCYVTKLRAGVIFKHIWYFVRF